MLLPDCKGKLAKLSFLIPKGRLPRNANPECRLQASEQAPGHAGWRRGRSLPGSGRWRGL